MLFPVAGEKSPSIRIAVNNIYYLGMSPSLFFFLSVSTIPEKSDNISLACWLLPVFQTFPSLEVKPFDHLRRRQLIFHSSTAPPLCRTRLAPINHLFIERENILFAPRHSCPLKIACLILIFHPCPFMRHKMAQSVLGIVEKEKDPLADKTTYKAIVVKHKPGVRSRLYWRLINSHNSCYTFSFRRDKGYGGVYSCNECKRLKKETTIEVCGNRFLSSPEDLIHICQPLAWDPTLEIVPQKEDKDEEETIPSPSSDVNPPPFQRRDPIEDEIQRQEKEDEERRKAGRPLLMDQIGVPDFYAAYTLLLQQQKDNEQKYHSNRQMI